MRPSRTANSINYDEIQEILLLYESFVPDKIQGLEELRLREVPEVLNKRKADGETFLEKTEVTGLVEWKLKHGTYRPNLAKLVASNSIEDIRATTKKAFAEYEAKNADFAHAITALSKLKGIGPATASLLLSCYDPDNVPFFSDELYRYLHWSDTKTKAWDRKISYTTKEYKDLYEKLQSLRERVRKKSGKTVKAIDVERMAFVLAKTAQVAKNTINDDSSDQALRPPSPKRRKKETPPPSQLPSDVCYRKGPRGSPTYDELGYELDYDYIAKCRGRPRKPGKRAPEKMKRMLEDDKRKAEIMGMDDRLGVLGAWEDRVAKDLGIAYHEVGMEEYEEWKKKGFHAEASEFENRSEEDRNRLIKLMEGSSFRKGSKRR